MRLGPIFSADWKPLESEVATEVEEIDLYEILEVERGASKEEIRKSYRKLALKHHPDKAVESEREAADIKFKSISQAYEILYDEDKRAAYDQHGMAAFDPSSGAGMGGGMDMDDILAQMFGGMGMPGMGGGGPGGRPRKPRRGQDEVTQYEVTLEDMFKGKTAHFNATKQIICTVCKGSGGKEGTKATECSTCKGSGQRMVLTRNGPMMMQQVVQCSTCGGDGEIRKDKDKCKKCKGKKTINEKKAFELYIPRGSRDGNRITLSGEADQSPGQEPGDLVFVLNQKPHSTFKRDGADLTANIQITLAEALCGFSRVVVKHLDGRGISLEHPAGKIMKPLQVLKVAGEGMPLKRGESKGDLYLMVDVEFPNDAFMKDTSKRSQLSSLLPPPAAAIAADVVDEVEYDPNADIDGFGTNEGGEDGEWEDDEEGGAQAQCAQQ